MLERGQYSTPSQRKQCREKLEEMCQFVGAPVPFDVLNDILNKFMSIDLAQV